MFDNIKTMVKVLYLFHSKNNLFDPSYRHLRNSNLLLLSMQSTTKVDKVVYFKIGKKHSNIKFNSNL